MQQIDFPQPFWSHLNELRTTIIRCIAAIALSVSIALYFHEPLFRILTTPVQSQGSLVKEQIRFERIYNSQSHPATFTLPENTRLLDDREKLQSTVIIPPNASIDLEIVEKGKKLVIFGPIEGFLTIIKTCFWTGFVGSSPIWLFMVLTYISPALYGTEKRRIYPFILMTLTFLGLGFAFAYYFTIPFANQFFLNFNLSVGENLWSLNHYLNYTILLLLSNGLAFELPVLLGFLVHYGVISTKALSIYRRHIYVCIFILSAILTPPDVLTQLMLAFPLIGIYECMLIYFRIGNYFRT